MSVVYTLLAAVVLCCALPACGQVEEIRQELEEMQQQGARLAQLLQERLGTEAGHIAAQRHNGALHLTVVLPPAVLDGRTMAQVEETVGKAAAEVFGAAPAQMQIAVESRTEGGQ